MNYHLFIYDFLFGLGAILNIILITAVLVMKRHKLDSLVVTFVLMTVGVISFQVTQIFGINAPTGEVSRKILMFNLMNYALNAFMTHWFLTLTGKIKDIRRRIALGLVYASGIVLALISLIYPQSYLHNSVPKLYLPFYFNPGPLYVFEVGWFIIVGLYYLSELLASYHKEKDPIQKNRYLYVLCAVGYGFVVGPTAFLLVFNVPFDPMWSAFFGLYTLLISYAIIRYQLLEVKVIIQRALIYAVAVVGLIGFISFSNYFSILLSDLVPGFPYWAMPTFSSFIGVGLGVIIWNKLRENDRLKYEFITIIAHKFRTPLTAIKWSTEELIATEQDEKRKENMKNVEHSTEKLVSLTGTLIDLADTNSNVDSFYQFKQDSLCALVAGIVKEYAAIFAQKGVLLVSTCQPEEICVLADRKRLIFSIQTLIENSLAYTPKGGKVSVTVAKDRRNALITITDSGIGISKKDIKLLFSQFYRSHKAILTDTEGFGVGFHLAQAVVKRHGGRIEAHSEGEDKGSTFTIILPVAQ